MDGVLNIALILASLGASPAGTGVAPLPAGLRVEMPVPSPAAPLPAHESTRLLQQDAWLGEDKFRHAGASWAAMVFTHAAARVVLDDSDAAFAVAVPVTAALGVAKEVVDRRRGGPFSARDLVADAIGAGAAWLFLREVH